MNTKVLARPEHSNDHTQAPTDTCQSEAELRKCHEAISSIDCMCQTQLGQISSLVSIMLRAMESPGYWKHPVMITETLGLIKFTADDCANFVNSMAEAVGSNYVDEIERAQTGRIWDAYRKANQKEVANV